MRDDTRFWDRVDLGHPLGCWVWTGRTENNGYGRICRGDGSGGTVSLSTHRYSYELLIGPIPDGLQIDHLCRVRTCVNPDHLELVSPRTNVLRAHSPVSVNARKSHCIKGHRLSGDNLYVRPNGRRNCLTCKREQLRAYRNRKKVAV